MRQFALKASKDGSPLCNVPARVQAKDQPTWRDWLEVPEPLYPSARAAGQAAAGMGADYAVAYLFEPGVMENGFMWCKWYDWELGAMS